ncbi:MAG: hypothetical protein ACKOZX_04910, partial [Gammaproteobacteria bacterium]
TCREPARLTDSRCPLFDQIKPEPAGADARPRDERLLEERIITAPTLDDAAALCRAEIERLSLVLDLCRQLRGAPGAGAPEAGALDSGGRESGSPEDGAEPSVDAEAARLERIMRTLIDRIDQRQDALEQLQALVLAARDPNASIH